MLILDANLCMCLLVSSHELLTDPLVRNCASYGSMDGVYNKRRQVGDRQLELDDLRGHSLILMRAKRLELVRAAVAVSINRDRMRGAGVDVDGINSNSTPETGKPPTMKVAAQHVAAQHHVAPANRNGDDDDDTTHSSTSSSSSSSSSSSVTNIPDVVTALVDVASPDFVFKLEVDVTMHVNDVVLKQLRNSRDEAVQAHLRRTRQCVDVQ